MPDAQLVVKVHRSLAACEPLEEELDALNERAERPSPFATWGYIRNYVLHDELHPGGAGRELVVLTAHAGERLVGYLPLARVHDRFLGVSFAKLQLLVTHDAERTGIVAEPAHVAACTEAFYRHLVEHEHGWQALEILDQDATSALRHVPGDVAAKCYVRLFDTPDNATIVVRWGSTDEYYRALKRKFRMNVARSLRRLFAAGEVEYVVGETADAARALLEVYVALEQRSWKALAGGHIGRHRERVAFFRGLCAPSQRMRLRVALVTVDGLPVAGFITGAYRERVYALQICHDETVSQLGPGQLLLFMAIRDAIADGRRGLHLMHGSTYYKQRWLADTVPVVSVQLFRRGTLPYVKARAGEVQRWAFGLLPDKGPVVYNETKRGVTPAVRARLAGGDRRPLRDAYIRALASGVPLRRYGPRELAAMLPFRIDGSTAQPAAEPTPPRVESTRVRPRAVAVFDADSPPALAFTRSLGRAGIPVHIYAPQRLSVAGASRYAAEFRLCPDPEDAASFLPWLESQIRSGDIELVAPTSDQLTYYLAECHSLLPPAAQQAIPTREALLTALFKDRFYARCAAQGVPAPWSVCPTSMDEMRAAAGELPYPSIIKPRTHVGVGHVRGIVVRDAQELAGAYHPYEVSPRNRLVFERFPELRWPMLQEYIPGALTSQFSVSGLLGRDGEVLAHAATRKTAQWPPVLGVGTCFEGCEETEILRLGSEAARLLGQRGLFELELIYDRRIGQLVALDLNPRAYGQIALDIARGHDLPLLWYRLASGDDLTPQRSAANHARWVHSIPFHVGSLVALLRGPERRQRLGAYLERLDSGYKNIDVVNDLGDPLPSVVFTAKLLRHPGGLIRPFFKDDS